VHVPLMFLSEWRGFLPKPCLRGKNPENSSSLDFVEITPIAKYASFQHLLQRKTCNSALEHTHVNNDTIDSVLRLREIGRANDISASPHSKSLKKHLVRDDGIHRKCERDLKCSAVLIVSFLSNVFVLICV
jgi:hypothetical protein